VSSELDVKQDGFWASSRSLGIFEQAESLVKHLQSKLDVHPVGSTNLIVDSFSDVY